MGVVVVSPKLIINPTLFVILVKNLGIIDLQYCNCCHIMCEISFKFQTYMTIFDYRNVGMQNIPIFYSIIGI